MINIEWLSYGKDILDKLNKSVESENVDKVSLNKALVKAVESENVDKVSLNKALVKAVESGNIGEVKVLIEKKADLNYQDEKGNTPLSMAVTHRDFDMVKLLVENGADPNIKVNNQSILRIAANNYDRKIIDYLDNLVQEKPDYSLNLSHLNLNSSKGGAVLKGSINLDHPTINGIYENFSKGYKMNISASRENIANTAFWQQFHIEIHNSDQKIGKALFIDAKDVVFDHTKLNCPNIYVVEGCKVTNIASQISSPIHYVSEQELIDIYNSYDH